MHVHPYFYMCIDTYTCNCYTYIHGDLVSENNVIVEGFQITTTHIFECTVINLQKYDLEMINSE